MNLYCSFVCERRPNWETLVPSPKKPGNVGDKKWAEEGLPAKWKEMEKEAAFHFTAGRVAKVIALGDEQTPGFGMYDGDAAGFVQLLVNPPVKTAVHLFAFDATDRFRQLLWTVASDTTTQVPFWLWTGASENQYSDWQDKFSTLELPRMSVIDLESLSGARGQKLPWGHWVRAWNVQPETAGAEWTPLHTAEVVRALARRMGYGNAK